MCRAINRNPFLEANFVNRRPDFPETGHYQHPADRYRRDAGMVPDRSAGGGEQLALLAQHLAPQLQPRAYSGSASA